MRLSLRTLLAFEDNIYDTEQHRQLERVIPKYDAAAMTLGRIRNVVRNPRLGVPGQVNRREELDPNLVAEYLDHQMSGEIQERFEAYCLSSDKFLAEVASIHQVLSNVLGEPARTSRECRLRCYDLYGTPPELPSFDENTKPGTIPQTNPEAFSRPESQEQNFEAFLRLFPETSENEPVQPMVRRTEPTEIPAGNATVYGETVRAIPFPVEIPSPNELRREPVTEYVPDQSGSFFAGIVRFFFQEKNASGNGPREDSETKKTTEQAESPRKAFSFWTLLLVFLLGFAALSGWNLIREGFDESRPGRWSKTPGDPENILEKDVFPVSLPNAAPEVPVAVIVPPEVPAEVPVKVPDPFAASQVPIPQPPPLAPPVIASVPETKVIPEISPSSPPMPPALVPPPVETEETVAISAPIPQSAPPMPLETVQVTPPPSEPAWEPAASAEPPTASVEPQTDPFLSASTQVPEPVQPVAWNAAVAPPAPMKKERVPNAFETKVDSVPVQVQTEKTPPSLPEAAPEPSPETPSEPALLVTPDAEKPANTKTLETVEAPPDRRFPSPPAQAFPEKESIIAFQPISAPPQKRSADLEMEVKPKADKKPTFEPVRSEPIRFEQADAGPQPTPKTAMKPAPQPFGNVVHPAATARQFGEVVPVGRILESKREILGRIPPLPEPSIVFSAPSAGDQWTLQPLPLELYADQYLLTLAPFRVDIDLGGVFRIEMVGDAKLCILAPDENGVPGIFVDYGRLVIRPNPLLEKKTPFALRIQTEKVEGVMEIDGPKSVAFVDTFAEVLPEPGTDIKTRVPKATPIIGFVPATEEAIRWQPTDRESPLTTSRQASVLLKPGKAEFGNIQSLPNWLQRTPLPAEGRSLAETCNRIFRENAGNSEASLHAMILEDSVSVRFFGYRLWGDLGRFDVPLSLMSEADPEEENVRQVLVPYFREVMKRDEETVQRLADAIEAVRR